MVVTLDAGFPLVAGVEKCVIPLGVVCLPFSGARKGPEDGVFPDQRGFRVVIRGGGGT